MKLKSVIIHKYKSFETDQKIDIEDDITILVGMNDSGKTSALESMAKANYFQKDKSFKLDLMNDFPRRERKIINKSDVKPKAVTCFYEISENLVTEIEKVFGKIGSKAIYMNVCYGVKKFGFKNTIKKKEFLKIQLKKLNIYSVSLVTKLGKISGKEDFKLLLENYTSDQKILNALKKLGKYFENKWGWLDPISEYFIRVYIDPNLPKFIYYDEYYSLPSKINIEQLDDDQLDEPEYKTARALLSDINIKELISSGDFEIFKAELEDFSLSITEEFFKYWHTNQDFEILFDVDKELNGDDINHILNVRIKDKGVSLPFKYSSRGFIWFFSFFVWFRRIQEDKDSQYILLLDEPGLSLHASAQYDLLRFLEDLSEKYQIIYTTHSPFMIDTQHLHRVRTVFKRDKKSVISDSTLEKDPNTIFPLQAALGYDIAQNLFISKKNLLVEGVSDLVILTTISSLLDSLNREGLEDDITIVPTGGLEKVATFISLLRGSKLDIVCLLDSYTDSRAKAKMDSMITQKIIHKNKIRFFDEFLEEYNQADLEDLFAKEDYLKLFKLAFSDHKDLTLNDLNKDIKPIIIQLNKYLESKECLDKNKRFNHYLPANELAKMGLDEASFTEETINNFEKVFIEINKLFK